MRQDPSTVEEFRDAIPSDAPPPGWSDAFKALWWDAAGNWEKAHDIAQEIHSSWGARMHAYLHRKEGDPWNAGYWYRTAGRPAQTGSLEEEFASLLEALL